MVAVQENKTNLVAAKAPVKMKALRDCRVNDVNYLIGSEFHCSEAEAVDFCKPITGSYMHDGFRNDQNAPLAQLIRAERMH